MIVVDANLVVAMLLSTAISADAAGVRRRDRHWLAPALLRYELASALSGYIAAKKLDRDDAIALYRRGLRLIEFADDELDPVSLFRHYVATPCSTYDIAYVCLAEARGLRLVTNDGEVLDSFPDVALSARGFLSAL